MVCSFKKLISIGSFHLHDQQWCPCHHDLKGLPRGYGICLESGRLGFALLSIPNTSISDLHFKDQMPGLCKKCI